MHMLSHDLDYCKTLSDHAIDFDYLYDQLLSIACLLPQPCLFCEVGTRAGGSALLALHAIKESGITRQLITIDPYGGKPFAAVHSTLPYNNWYDDTFYRSMMKELADFCAEHALQHTHFKITSQEFIATFEQMHLWQNQQTLEPLFGYVYLDGEHTPETVGQELAWFLPRLSDGGLLVIDDIENLVQTTDPLITEVLSCSDMRYNRAFFHQRHHFCEKPLVVTIAIGEDYQRLARITHPTLKTYAKRIGAEFLALTESKIATTTPHWEKFQLADLLERYRRVLYIDTDILIRSDCPDLFALVPETHLGMFNEGPFTERSRELLIETCKAYGRSLPTWDGRYFNTGVMVLSHRHQGLFRKPEHEHFSFYEQTYLNMMIAAQGTTMYALPYQFNRMTCVDSLTGEHRLASYIVHYAGAPNTETVIDLARRDRRKWQRHRGQFCFRRHIHVAVTGGLGDQVNAEPALRFMRHEVYPDDVMVVTTNWPELFAHLNVEVHLHGAWQPKPDTPYYSVNSLPSPESLTWMVVSNLLCHTVDFCSIALLRRTLPLAEKRVHLQVRKQDATTLHSLLGTSELGDFCVVHCGRHWNTKTFPAFWWQEVVDSLTAVGQTVCLIGHDDTTRGVVPIMCPSSGIDLRQQLTLGQLLVLLKEAPVLVSNDSAPIHLAGAFENSIVLIPSCKHPEHVLPYRHGNVFWHAQALYKRLTLEDVSSKPTEIHGSSAEFFLDDQQWMTYLPEPSEVVDAVLHPPGKAFL